MTGAFLLRLMRREARGLGGRGAFFVASLAVGVAAVVAVGGLAAALDAGIRSEARGLLAADLVVSSRRPLPPALDELIARRGGVRRADVAELATMAAAPSGRSLLVQLKAVGPGYPFHGEVSSEPSGSLAELLTPGSALLSTEAMARLEVGVGEEVLLGGEPFRVAATLLAEPDRLAASFTAGPRVLVSLAGLERTGLVGLGSRVRHRALLAIADERPAAARELAATLKAELPDAAYLRVETAEEALPSLRDGIRRVERFLALVALLSLLVGGVGVAQAVRSWLASRMDSTAVLRCLGLRAREVLVVYAGQAALLALAGSVIGAGAGIAVQSLAPRLLGDLLPAVELSPWRLAPVARGVGLGVAVALLFALPPLLATRRVPPLRVLRRDVEPLPSRPLTRAAGLAGLVLAIGALSAWQAHSLVLGAQFAGSAVATAAVLALAASAVVRGLGRVPRGRLRLWLRHGLAAVARPGADTRGAIVALGLGVLVVLAMAVVERHLSRALDADLPRGAPSSFMIDVQPDQWPDLERALRDAGATEVRSVPLVVARLREVDGASVATAALGSADGEEGRRDRWALTREQRLTVLAELPEDNEIVAGAWFSAGAENEVSVEEEFAREIGARLGSRLVLDVQGVPVALTVTSLRKVEWRTFNINFFLVVEPGPLDAAPASRIAAARVPPGRDQAVQDAIARAFPNVTVIPVREVLEKVSSVIEQIGVGVRFLGAFTVIAGIAILGGAASSRAARRGREVALLKTLGFTRAGVAAVFAVEYALVGLVAGVIGAAGGALLSGLVIVRGMELPFAPDPVQIALAVLGAALVTTAAGLLASTSALRRRPIEVLRSE